MFTTNHFIWLGISLLIIVGYQLLNKKFKLSLDTNLTILFIVCLASELLKTFSNIELGSGTEGGWYLDPGDLPFHLCSMQIFFVTAVKFFVKNEDKKHTLLCFMFPTMLLGGIIALFIPTVGVKFTRPQVYQFFIFHAVIVAFSIYLVRNRIIKMNFKTLKSTFGILGILLFCAIWINSALNAYDANFFYLSMPPMENLPILNLDNGWFAYFFSLITIAVVAILAVTLPFIIVNEKKEKNNEKVLKM